MTSIPKPIADQLLRRMAMLIRDDSPLQDVIDLAETSLACGDADGALILFGAAALERGFDDRGLAWQLETGARTGLWSAVPQHSSEPHVPMLEKVRQELAELLVVFPASGEPGDPTAITPTVAEAEAPITLLPVFDKIVGVRMRQMLETASIEAVAVFATELGSATIGYLPFTVSMHAGAPAKTLVTMVAFNRLRRFDRLHYELLGPPFGSAALFEHVSRLSCEGLGPYFSNVSRLAKDAGGLLGMLRLANGGNLSRENLGRWALLVSVGFPAGHLQGFVPMLASLEQIEYLRILILRAGRSADRTTLWVVRDACLAIGQGNVAAAAQTMLTKVAPRDWAEWIILGDFHALLGDLETAEQTYRHCLTIRPDEVQIFDRLKAIRSGDIKTSIFLFGFFAGSRRGFLGLR